MNQLKRCLAIDGGTSNTRVRLLDDNQIIDSVARPVGVRDVAIAGSPEPLQRAMGESIRELLDRTKTSPGDIDLACASGMLTSNVGLYEVPHVHAPAGIDELARGSRVESLAEIPTVPLYLIPGIKTVPLSATLEHLAAIDILRGEEAETLGILAMTGASGPIDLLLPGSHTKFVRVDASNRIRQSYTTVAGELTQALAERTILSSSIKWPTQGEPDWPALEMGAQIGLECGLLRGAFAVRLADVVLQLDGNKRTWFFVGVVAACDIEAIASKDRFESSHAILVGGREPLRAIYAHLIRRIWNRAADSVADYVVESATARGAVMIAGRARELAARMDSST